MPVFEKNKDRYHFKTWLLASNVCSEEVTSSCLANFFAKGSFRPG